MMDILVDYIGGKKRIERNNRYCVWSAYSKTDLLKISNILAKYPLLTTTKQLQWEFLIKYANNKKNISKKEWFILRDKKYEKRENLLKKLNMDLPHYFPGWLSGFIEAEGHFKLIKSFNNNIQNSQFVIGQNYDIYILNYILIYFNCNKNKISYNKLKYYRIHISDLKSRILINNHFDMYPLLGYKYSQYIWWKIHH